MIDWILRNIATIIISLIIIGLAALAARYLIKKSKSGECVGCKGDCSGCIYKSDQSDKNK